MKRFFTVFMCFALFLSLSIPAFATEVPTTHSFSHTSIVNMKATTLEEIKESVVGDLSSDYKNIDFTFVASKKDDGSQCLVLQGTKAISNTSILSAYNDIDPEGTLFESITINPLIETEDGTLENIFSLAASYNSSDTSTGWASFYDAWNKVTIYGMMQFYRYTSTANPTLTVRPISVATYYTTNNNVQIDAIDVTGWAHGVKLSYPECYSNYLDSIVSVDSMYTISYSKSAPLAGITYSKYSPLSGYVYEQLNSMYLYAITGGYTYNGHHYSDQYIVHFDS